MTSQAALSRLNYAAWMMLAMRANLEQRDVGRHHCLSDCVQDVSKINCLS